MSIEVHNYSKLDFNYDHFDSYMRQIAKKFCETDRDTETREVDWRHEVGKYLVFVIGDPFVATG